MDLDFRKIARHQSIVNDDGSHSRNLVRSWERQGQFWRAFNYLQENVEKASSSVELLRIASILKDQQTPVISELPEELQATHQFYALDCLQRSGSYWQSIGSLQLSVWPIVAWKVDLALQQAALPRLIRRPVNAQGLVLSNLAQLSHESLQFCLESLTLQSIVLADFDHSVCLELIEKLPKLNYLNLETLQISMPLLHAVAQNDQLRALQFQSSSFNDRHLEFLSQGSPKITSLDLWNTQITDLGLNHLPKFKQLEKLVLGSTWISDIGLETLEGMSNLRLLNLRSTHASFSATQKLKDKLPNCQIMTGL